MTEKIYSFAGFRFVIRSELSIADNEIYKNFITDNGGKEITVQIVDSVLPEKEGKLVYENSTCRFYVSENGEFLYTSYPVKAGESKEFACRVIKDDKITLYLNGCDELWDAMIMEALKIPEILLKYDCATLHCSFIDVDGGAVLFAADKQMGKSTQAALWKKYRNAETINGDRAALRIIDGTVYACGIPFCGSSRISVNKILPVKAVVFLGKALSNTAAKVDQMNAFIEFLSKLTYEPADENQLHSALGIAEYVSRNIPVYKLVCRPDEGAVKALEEKICQKQNTVV